MSQLASEIANFRSGMPDNSLDELDLVDMAYMDLMMAIEVFIFARDGFFHVMKCCSESEGFGFDACGVVFQISEGLVDFAIAVIEGETERSRGVCHWLYNAERMERETRIQDSLPIYTMRTGECGQSILTWGKNSA
jgi:hypothetical protein